MTQISQAKPLRASQLLILLGCLLAGIGSALFVMPMTFRHIPSDISRIGVLLDAMHGEGANPKVVVFGNSTVMSGIDAQQLSAELPGNPLAWSLSSTGQALTESFMLSQELPASVEVAVYGSSLRPSAHEVPLIPVKSNAFYLYGWRPTDDTKKELERAYGQGVGFLMRRSHLSQLFDGRWALRQLLDTQLRILLRKDLSLAEAESTLFHAQRYTAPVESDLLDRAINLRVDSLQTGPPHIPPRDREMLLSIGKQGEASGRRIAVLILPVHPAVYVPHAQAFRDAVTEARNSQRGAPETLVIDASTLLDASLFFDALHPSNDGARKLTSFVAAQLREGF